MQIFKMQIFNFLALAIGFVTLCAAEQTYKINIKNNCRETLWPALAEHNFRNLPNFKVVKAPNRGHMLKPGQSWTANVPIGWVGGRVWARQGCNAAATRCRVGQCPGGMQCADYNWLDKTTLCEFGYGKPTDESPFRIFYNISTIPGFNVPVRIQEHPSGRTKTAKTRNPARDQAWLWVDRNIEHSPAVNNAPLSSSFTITFCPN